jgi:tRNA(Ile)-lysidine synthetase-like protein
VPLEAVHVEAALHLCASTAGTRTVDLPSGMVAERRYRQLRLGLPATDPGPVEVAVPCPGAYPFLGAIVDISPDAFTAFMPLGAGAALVLRNPRPGDRIPGRRAKLKELLIDRRIPRPERRKLPLLIRRTAAGDELLWAAGLVGEGAGVSAR